MQSADRGAEMRAGVVPEFRDQRMALERRLHNAALHATAASVDQTKLAKTGVMRRADEFFDHGWNVMRRERVQIQFPVDGHVDDRGWFFWFFRFLAIATF